MSTTFRTDTHNNPTAFTTDIANEAGLKLGVEYSQGDSFESGGHTYHTARLIGDAITITTAVINRLSFCTPNFHQRWAYIAIPKFTWDSLTNSQKRDVIGWMYQREGGTAMKNLFPNYGKL